MRSRNIQALASAVVACASLVGAIDVAAQPVDPVATQQLHALFDDSWDATMRRYPEWATYIGDNRYGDKLFEATREGEVADKHPARYDGRTDGKTMTLEVTLTDSGEKLGTFTLQRGGSPGVFKCL